VNVRVRSASPDGSNELGVLAGRDALAAGPHDDVGRHDRPGHRAGRGARAGLRAAAGQEGGHATGHVRPPEVDTSEQRRCGQVAVAQPVVDRRTVDPQRDRAATGSRDRGCLEEPLRDALNLLGLSPTTIGASNVATIATIAQVPMMYLRILLLGASKAFRVVSRPAGPGPTSSR
jgi:hypothetical protein